MLVNNRDCDYALFCSSQGAPYSLRSPPLLLLTATFTSLLCHSTITLIPGSNCILLLPYDRRRPLASLGKRSGVRRINGQGLHLRILLFACLLLSPPDLFIFPQGGHYPKSQGPLTPSAGRFWNLTKARGQHHLLF